MRLLIAEDDKALALFLSRGLEAEGYRVTVAHDGVAAVEAFRLEGPDLTILDLNLPVKDGEQALAEMRAQEGQQPILVLTGRMEVETRVRCLDLGADDLMVKPFSLAMISHGTMLLWCSSKETNTSSPFPRLFNPQE